MKNDNKKVILNEQLQDCLKTVGTSPFDEPELFEAIDSESPKKSSIVKIALARKDLDMNAFDAEQIATFYSRLREQIISLKVDEDTYKVTPATKNYRLPNFEEVETLTELGNELSDLYEQKAAVSEDGTTKLKKDVMTVLKKLDDVLWSITNLNKDDLTAWEVQLISEQIFTYARDVEKTSMGKPLSI